MQWSVLPNVRLRLVNFGAGERTGERCHGGIVVDVIAGRKRGIETRSFVWVGADSISLGVDTRQRQLRSQFAADDGTVVSNCFGHVLRHSQTFRIHVAQMNERTRSSTLI